MGFPLVGVVIATVLLILYLKNKGKNKKHGLKEIPGPTGLPVIGNMHQLGKFPNDQFSKWSKEYGSIYKVSMPGQLLIVVSDPKLSKEIYSVDNAYTGKPSFEGFDLYEKDGQGLGMFQSEGETWEVHRRFLLRQLRDFGFGKSAMETYIMEELREVLDNLKKHEGKPIGELRETLRLAVVNSLWTILSSNRFKHDDPNLINLSNNTTEAFNEALDGGGLLIFFPWLRHIIPGLSGYTKLRSLLNQNLEVFETAVKEHKRAFDENNLRDYIDVYLAEVKKATDPKSPFYGERAERFLASELFDLFFAGSDTSAVTITWTVFFLCKFPNIQKKFQEEIAEITGNSRKVSVTDRPDMPFTQALIDEVLRHSSIVPDGVQHRVLADREFHGYHIPKESWVQPNLYFIHHDPKIWGDPNTFRPERFLSEDGKKYQKSDNVQAFQVGKRQCVGETLARDTVFLFTTNIFQQFSIEFDPSSPEPTFEIQPGFFRVPKPFKIVMKDRIANAK